MRVLLIHQNFPGQYKHLGPALAARGDEVIALTPKVKKPAMWNGVRILPYGIRRSSSKGVRMRIRNQNNHLHFPVAEAGLSPTHFQADTFPPSFRKRITVQHDGIDTDLVAPKPDAVLELDNGAKLTRDDEVVTFINRNLEPYRGYHIFMRALPELLKKRPNAQVVMLGGDETSYGARPPKGKT